MLLPWTLLIFMNTLVLDSHAFDALPRWGHATVVVNDALYIYGGKIDQFNSFSYTSAPNTNDVLYLNLAEGFSAASPPWVLVSGSSNSSSVQGPALAWHSASAFTTSRVLVFGGSPDANSDIVLVGGQDSASILDIFNRLAPVWTVESSAWADQPTRRIHHSTATIASGLVFIFGGERADGSGTAFSDHYVFDPNIPSFSVLPTIGAPPDLVGHVSIPLWDGRILVFGGYSPSSSILLLFSTIHVLDTTRSPYAWSLLRVSSGTLPSPRRAFAAALIPGNRILIHGGSDAQLQTNLDDGWILDLSQPLAVWARVDSLTGVGPRRDHSAICSGDQVIFGFGYSQSSPSPDPVQVYDLPRSSIVPSFTPRASDATPTATLPPVTNDPRPTGSGVTPVITGKPTHPDTPSDAEGKKKKTTAIAVGAAFGVLALAALVVGAVYYRRRKQRKWEQRRFWVIDGDDAKPLDDDDSQIHRDIPLAGHNEPGASEMGQRTLPNALLTSLGIAALLGKSTTKKRDPQDARERRNMLDDEDAADFGTWYNSKKRDGTGGSTWSLMSILTRKNREPSQTSHLPGGSGTPWHEKGDPFSDGDGASLMQDEEAGVLGASAPLRPRARRELSHVSTRSGLSYSDPFSDPIQEEAREPSDTAYQDVPATAVRLVPPPSSLANIRTSLPLDFTGHALSPLSERTSQSTLLLHDSASSMGGRSSSDHAVASRDTSATSHYASGDPPKSPTLLSGLLPPSETAASGSWWSRLARRASDASSRSATHQYRDIRDPNPPPRLAAIDEKTTPERETPESKRSSMGSVRRSASASAAHPYVAKHGKSMSSVRTADSEAIERMAGTMEVAQRMHSESNRGSVYSTETTGQYSVDEHGNDVATGKPVIGEVRVMSPLEMGELDRDIQHQVIGGGEDGGETEGASGTALRAPVPVKPIGAGTSILSTTSSASSSKSASPLPSAAPSSFAGGAGGLRSAPLPPPLAPSGGVAARVQALENRRLTLEDRGPVRSPAEGRKSGVGYELIPRRSLFIVNPDRQTSGSSE